VGHLTAHRTQPSLPEAIATGDATRRLVDGEMVAVDGALGTVAATP